MAKCRDRCRPRSPGPQAHSLSTPCPLLAVSHDSFKAGQLVCRALFFHHYGLSAPWGPSPRPAPQSWEAVRACVSAAMVMREETRDMPEGPDGGRMLPGSAGSSTLVSLLSAARRARAQCGARWGRCSQAPAESSLLEGTPNRAALCCLVCRRGGSRRGPVCLLVSARRRPPTSLSEAEARLDPQGQVHSEPCHFLAVGARADPLTPLSPSQLPLLERAGSCEFLREYGRLMVRNSSPFGQGAWQAIVNQHRVMERHSLREKARADRSLGPFLLPRALTRGPGQGP